LRFKEYFHTNVTQFYTYYDSDYEAEFFVIGHLNKEKNYYTFTKNNYWRGMLWYSSIYMFNSTVNTKNEVEGLGTAYSVIPDKIGFM
jgi:hypothetical protein